ncbi:MAG: hypothetical protein AAF798_10625 [Bacteroidota bacterium]
MGDAAGLFDGGVDHVFGFGDEFLEVVAALGGGKLGDVEADGGEDATYAVMQVGGDALALHFLGGNGGFEQVLLVGRLHASDLVLLRKKAPLVDDKKDNNSQRQQQHADDTQ